MAPIYESDVAEERWSKAEWENYELWERIELRLRRRRQLWIAGTVVVFLLLSAIPIVRERMPAWRSLRAARTLAQEIGRMKRDAAIEHRALRIAFTDPSSLRFEVQSLQSCSAAAGSVVRSGALLRDSAGITLVEPRDGQAVDVPGLASSFCYDAMAGSASVLAGNPVVGFAVLPVKDLAQGRQDRMSLLLLKGPSAEITFE
jgi:hypothetical protein